MAKEPNFENYGGVTGKDSPINDQSNYTKPKSNGTRFKGLFANGTFLNKFIRVLLAFAVAWFVVYLANRIWFYKYPASVNNEWAFWAVTGGSFIAAAIILMVVNAVVKTEGNATKLAFILLFFVTAVQHYLPVLYYNDGKPIVYINSRTGEVFQKACGPIHHDAKSNRDYFLDPRSNDTCWNDSPKNIGMVKASDDNQNVNSDYNPPTEVITYKVRKEPYTFTLKAGQTLNHWIALPQNGGVQVDLVSSDYNHYLIYSESEQYYCGADVVIPGHDGVSFFLKAGNTDQVITMKLSYH